MNIFTNLYNTISSLYKFFLKKIYIYIYTHTHIHITNNTYIYINIKLSRIPMSTLLCLSLTCLIVEPRVRTKAHLLNNRT